MSGAGVGRVLDAMVALYTAAKPAGDPDVSVHDGRAKDPLRKFLCVGFDESDQPAVQVTRSPSDAGLAQEFETLDVSCLLSCWRGDQTAAQLRSETLALYDTFDQALAADRQLGGVAMLARVSSYEYLADDRGDGFIAQIRFTVSVQSLN